MITAFYVLEQKPKAAATHASAPLMPASSSTDPFQSIIASHVPALTLDPYGNPTIDRGGGGGGSPDWAPDWALDFWTKT